MGEKDPMPELVIRLIPYLVYIGKTIRHVKTAALYRVAGVHFREADMSIEFKYMPIATDIVSFSRPIGELLDGRFEVL